MYKLSTEQKKVVIEQQRARREAKRKGLPVPIKEAKVKKPRSREKVLVYLATAKAKRVKARADNPKPDMRLTANRVKVNPAMHVVPEKRLPQSPKVTLLRKERKPKQQSDRMVIPVTPPMTEYTYIPELKMSVHLEKGQTIAQVIAKYNQRPGNKIGKW